MADLPDIEQQLSDVAEQRRTLQGLHVRRAEVERSVQEALVALGEADAALQAEESEVEALRTVSLTRILASIRGTRDADLSREEAERDLAAYALQQARRRVETSNAALAAVDASIAALDGLDDRWERALAAKEAHIARTDHPLSPELADIASRRGVLRAQLQESFEAASAGRFALEALAQAHALLVKADSWSGYDTWFGGGMISSSIKHDRIDEAAAVLRRVDDALARLSEELADLGRSGFAAISVRTRTRTFDIFFDNIFSDLKVRDQIRDGLARVKETHRQVAATLTEVEAQGESMRTELEALARRRVALLA